MANLSLYCEELIKDIKKQKIRDQKSLNKLKMALAKKHKIKVIPKNAEILNYASEKDRDALNFVLSMKPVRLLSGVAVVAIMTQPSKCPHGKCSFCPGGIKSEFGDVPQSYTGKEPTTRRAIRNLYDPYLQIFNRLEQYIVMNKIPDKVEIIVMGGTFPARDKRYQDEFITYTFKAMNDFSALFFNNKTNKLKLKEFLDFFELPGEIHDEERQRKIHEKCLMIKSAADPADLLKTHGVFETPKISERFFREVWNSAERSNTKHASNPSRKLKPNTASLKNEQSKNQTSKIRCVGLTIETRPDWASLELANSFLDFGCTRVELGVQSVYDSVLKKVERGHKVKDTIEATRTLKDLGFKINYQVMPGLPGVSKQKDIQALKTLFSNPDFRPDMLKIYPCMVMKGTKLYLEWKKGKFKPLTTKDAAEMIAEFKKNVPEYVRIMRVQRDIPTFATESGVDKTNLRQYIESLMKKKGIVCRCIRCREIGRYDLKKAKAAKKGKGKKTSRKASDTIKIIGYNASKGKEFFIAAEHDDFILGFCRLRFPSRNLRKEIAKDSALIRELHVYGAASEVGEKNKEKTQHKGIGKALLKQAESIAKSYKKKKIVIISGVGVREYYKKLGYRLEGPYMVKTF